MLSVLAASLVWFILLNPVTTLEGTMELHMHEGQVLFLPVNVLMVWHASFLGCMTLLLCLNHAD